MTINIRRVQPNRIVSRYVAGGTLREIAKIEGVSHETVRRFLIQAGVKLRVNRRLGGRLGTEVLAELQRFPKGLSAPELVEWLGEDRKAILATLTSLIKHGYVSVVVRPDPVALRPAEITEDAA